MSTAGLDQICGDVLRIVSTNFDPRDLLTFNLTCKSTLASGRQRLLATAYARTGVRIALRRTRFVRACREGLAKGMTQQCCLSDRDECFAKITQCLYDSEDPLSDLTTALHKTQTALIEQSYAAPSAVKPILEDVGLWIMFVCLAAWRLHMQRAPGVPRQAHTEVAQHDIWGILSAPAVGAGDDAAAAQVEADDDQGTSADTADLDYVQDVAGHIMFGDLLAGLKRMVYNTNPSKKPGLATLNIIVHFLLQTCA
jgi:hypothetical protein